ncbi:hypothetical protein JW905_11020, partial [bacterium]|nr:hypothetical protein [candidate division CSSED10-310 bacterium]
MSGQICAHCQVWEVIEDDRYCANCGRNLRELGLEVRDDKDRLLAHDKLFLYGAAGGGAVGARNLNLTIRNAGSLPVTIDGFDTTPREAALRLMPAGDKKVSFSDITIDPGKDIKAILRMDVGGVGKEGFSGRLDIKGRNMGVMATLNIGVAPYPADMEKAFRLDVPKDIDISKDDPWGELTGAVLVEESAALIEAITSSMPEVTVTCKAEMPAYVPAGDRLPFGVRIDAGRWPAEKKKTDICVLTFRFVGLDKPIEHKVEIRLQEPGVIKCSPPVLRLPWVMRGGRAEMEFRLENRGGMPVTVPVEGIRTKEPSWISVSVTEEPEDGKGGAYRLAPGEHRKCRLTVDAGGLTSDFKTGHESMLFVNYNQRLQLKVPIIIDRIDARILPGWLALDFGTTNSSCAVADITDPRRQNVKSVTYDEVYKDEPRKVSSLASAITFEDLGNHDAPGYRIGQYAEVNLHVETRIHSTLSSVKRFLGRHLFTFTLTDPIKVQIQKYTPEEVCGFIIKRLLKRAETQLGRRIAKVISTFPTA